jgi:hypothetical protein
VTRVYDVGFEPDTTRLIPWQYDSAANLRAITLLIKARFDELYRDFWDDWIADVVDLRTANEFGLTVWSIILNQDLGDDPDDATISSKWAFGALRKNFSFGNFAPLPLPYPGFSLSTEGKRLALRLRYFSVSYAPTIPNINFILSEIFAADYGPAWVLDPGDMTIRYIFDFDLTEDLVIILENLDVFPRPAAVKLRYRRAGSPSWAFGAERQNFSNGNFIGFS